MSCTGERSWRRLRCLRGGARGPGQRALWEVRRAAGPISYGKATAYSMAMHIHSSFSEQSGAMDGQLNQAMQNLVDIFWWNGHDHRMDGFNYRNMVHFTSAAEAGAAAGRRPEMGHEAQHRSRKRLGSAVCPVSLLESFTRPQVLAAAGNVIAAGNPSWLLRKTPPGGIPAPRQA